MIAFVIYILCNIIVDNIFMKIPAGLNNSDSNCMHTCNEEPKSSGFPDKCYHLSVKPASPKLNQLWANVGPT